MDQWRQVKSFIFVWFLRWSFSLYVFVLFEMFDFVVIWLLVERWYWNWVEHVCKCSGCEWYFLIGNALLSCICSITSLNSFTTKYHTHVRFVLWFDLYRISDCRLWKMGILLTGKTGFLILSRYSSSLVMKMCLLFSRLMLLINFFDQIMSNVWWFFSCSELTSHVFPGCFKRCHCSFYPS